MATLGPDRIPVITMSFVALVLMVTVVSQAVYKIHKNRLDDALKRDLLDRGMSADEIATVLGARTHKSGCGRSRLSA
jgi:hypothetical protein